MSYYVAPPQPPKFHPYWRATLYIFVFFIAFLAYATFIPFGIIVTVVFWLTVWLMGKSRENAKQKYALDYNAYVHYQAQVNAYYQNGYQNGQNRTQR